jgi:hypothetical protein
VIIGAELVTKATGPEQRNLGSSLQFKTAPDEPKIEIQAARGIDQCAHNVQIRRNRMMTDFLPELLAQSDEVIARRAFAGPAVFHVPESHMIEDGEPAEFPNPRSERRSSVPK